MRNHNHNQNQDYEYNNSYDNTSRDRNNYYEQQQQQQQQQRQEQQEEDIEVVYSMGKANTANTTNSNNNSSNSNNPFSWLWNTLVCKCVLPLFVVCGTIAGIMIAFGISPDKDDLPQPFQEFLFSRDGWEGLTVEELPQWNTNGRGVLELTMLNGLEEKWQSYFTTSINEWNNGDPDVIEVTVTKVDPNPNCEFVRGEYTICNGDYGDTSFDGVNEVLVKNGRITASVAKMNDYYMDQASEARKQYTMCHEIGHGFGLPHSDENFYNLNLGNCMDYTDRPWSNTSPDKQTFELLQEIYGIPEMGPSDAELAASAAQQQQQDGGGGEETVIRSESKRTGIRTPFLRSSTKNDQDNDDDDDDDEIPSIIAQRAIEAALHLETNFHNPLPDDTNDTDNRTIQQKQKQKRHQEDKFASFQVDLGEGYSLQAHFLIHKH